jgi:ABC-type maltose transport system permease subunit
MLIHSQVNQTFAVGLTSFVTESGVDWGMMTAAATIALIPVCAFFGFAQRYLVHNTMLGALTG